MSRKVVVIGAGQAGFSFAEQVRKLDSDADISLLGAEQHLPYQRPPLSKRYVKNELPLEKLYLRPQSWLDKKQISCLAGDPVTAVDTGSRIVTTASGVHTEYDTLAIATGSRPRSLPGSAGGHYGNVFTLRDINDADHMRGVIERGGHLLIIGGGYIGLEAAAVARSAGMQVTVVELAPRLLQRVACEQTASLVRELHVSSGVLIKESTGIETLLGDTNAVTAAVLSDGEELAVDAVLVGIGVDPETRLAEAAGLQLDNGIAVDQHCETSQAGVFAFGDCASFEYKGRRIRLESVQNAVDQARAAAFNACGQRDAYVPMPWFWSEQYDMTLQIAGLSIGYTEVVERAGSKAGSCSFWYYDNDSVLAVDVVNEPATFMTTRRLMQNGVLVTREQASDAAFELKLLLQAGN